MTNERITRREIDAYKREVLESCVLVRIAEAAMVLAVSKSTVLRRVEEGHLTPYTDSRNGNGIRFLASELQRYVREMRQNGFDKS